MINIHVIEPMWQVLVYILFLLYVLYEFRKNQIFAVLLYTLVSILIVSGTQIATYMFLFVVPAGKMRILLASLLSLIVLWSLIHYGELINICKYVISNNRAICLVIIFCGFTFGICIILSKVIKMFSFMNCLLIYVIFLLLVVFSQQWKNEREKRLSEARELRVLQQCTESFECLIENVRSKQHEFNNQLEAVYNIISHPRADYRKRNESERFFSCEGIIIFAGNHHLSKKSTILNICPQICAFCRKNSYHQ